MIDDWKEKTNPARLERRYIFGDYDTLRAFLDEAADLSEQIGYYPDMGFGKDYVNIVVYAEEGDESVDDTRRDFARQLDGLHAAKSTS